jgi:hypothetical protein
MNKRTTKNDWINAAGIMYTSLTMILLSLLVTWGIELLMKELYRLG